MKKEQLLQFMGEVVRQKRKAAGISGEQLAKFINLSRASIINIESGRHQPPVEKLFMLCRLFGCQINELFPPAEAISFEIQERLVTVRKQKKIRSIKVIK